MYGLIWMSCKGSPDDFSPDFVSGKIFIGNQTTDIQQPLSLSSSSLRSPEQNSDWMEAVDEKEDNERFMGEPQLIHRSKDSR